VLGPCRERGGYYVRGANFQQLFGHLEEGAGKKAGHAAKVSHYVRGSTCGGITV
jgi:hypothetical protein